MTCGNRSGFGRDEAQRAGGTFRTFHRLHFRDLSFLGAHARSAEGCLRFSKSPVGSGRIICAQRFEDSRSQQLVLLAMAARPVRRSHDNLPAHHLLFRQELVRCEIHIRSVGKPVPVVVTNLYPVDVDLREDELTAEDILHDQSRHAALVASRILRGPLLAHMGVAGIRPPCRLEIWAKLNSRNRHSRILPSASDTATACLGFPRRNLGPLRDRLSGGV